MENGRDVPEALVGDVVAPPSDSKLRLQLEKVPSFRKTSPTRGQYDLEDRKSLRRVSGLSTELQDVSEVEYRELRLEKVVLIGVYSGSTSAAENSLRELAALCETAGATVLEGVVQRLSQPNAANYLGSGKIREVSTIVTSLKADTVVADSELSPSQRRALEDVLLVKVIDRTAVILDIFAQHAKTREGKAQVELAQLRYLLPRLRGWGESMSRQAGGQVGGAGSGMGSRGPGETKIELDRRRINSRISKLRRQIKTYGTTREANRKNRTRSQLPSVAVVGYTNAGKSSLLNNLTKAGVLVQDALFATLDPTVRRAKTAAGRPITITDTVGFVRSLPHQLVEAFRSTLEEVSNAQLLIHVVDASHPEPQAQLDTVRSVLRDLGDLSIPEIVVFNKIDLAGPSAALSLRAIEPKALFVSALSGEGIASLREELDNCLPGPSIKVRLHIPFDRGDLVALLHDEAIVLACNYRASGTFVLALIHESQMPHVRSFLTEASFA